eukprot:TRINITY_DN25329_c0_g1_i1.p1 TRINITY_DN25329_c0_g1~~TRINITY_DN25329_c0_g1_i1.p1  ORF type:complete len:542 (-),score=42.41 TRINITY_DN25329_c0_g1_i1:50-1504(-)
MNRNVKDTIAASSTSQVVEEMTTASPSERTRANAIKVGFVAPSGVSPGFVRRVDSSQINIPMKFDPDHPGAVIVDMARLESNLELSREANHTMHLDLTWMITEGVPHNKLNMTYSTSSGFSGVKMFPPFSEKLRMFKPDLAIHQAIASMASALSKFHDVIDTFYLVDEPYLNGVPKSELERVSRLIRRSCLQLGLPAFRRGIIFTGAFFNKYYGEELNRCHGDYVKHIDDKARQKYEHNDKKTYDKWYAKATLNAGQRHRVTSYDLADNLYREGGIPRDVEVIAVDEYASALFWDLTRDSVLHFFWTVTRVPACQRFGTSVARVREQLREFFRNPSTLWLARLLLDDIFFCRWEAIVALLRREVGERESSISFAMVSESSITPYASFRNEIKKTFKESTVSVMNRLICDDITRSAQILQRYPGFFSEVLYFTYESVRDNGIEQSFDGVDAIPEAMEMLESMSARNGNKMDVSRTSDWQMQGSRH